MRCQDGDSTIAVLAVAYLVVPVCVSRERSFSSERRMRGEKLEGRERALLRLMSRDTCLFPTFFFPLFLSLSSSPLHFFLTFVFLCQKAKEEEQESSETSVKTTFSTSAFCLLLSVCCVCTTVVAFFTQRRFKYLPSSDDNDDDNLFLFRALKEEKEREKCS